MTEGMVHPTVGEMVDGSPSSHPALIAIAGARDQRPVIIVFLRAFS
jgi:hypothetical protein